MLLTLAGMATLIMILGMLSLHLIWGAALPKGRMLGTRQDERTRRGPATANDVPLVKRPGLTWRKANRRRRPRRAARSVKVPDALAKYH